MALRGILLATVLALTPVAAFADLAISGQDGKQVRAVSGHGDEVYKVVSHPGQVVLATCSADRTVRLWKEDGNPQRTLTGLSDQVYSLAISADGGLVAAGAWDGEVRVWKVADGKLVKGFNASPGYQPAASK